MRFLAVLFLKRYKYTFWIILINIIVIDLILTLVKNLYVEIDLISFNLKFFWLKYRRDILNLCILYDWRGIIFRIKHIGISNKLLVALCEFIKGYFHVWDSLGLFLDNQLFFINSLSMHDG